MNPIKEINGIKNFRVPSTYKVSVQDVSLPGAGRTMDAKMHKKRIGQKIKIELEWKKLSFSEATTILGATSKEYFNATVMGLGGAFTSKTFYRGDVVATFYGEPANVWYPVTMSWIER